MTTDYDWTENVPRDCKCQWVTYHGSKTGKMRMTTNSQCPRHGEASQKK